MKSLYSLENAILKVDIRKFFDNIDKGILFKLLDEYEIDDYVYSLIRQSLNPTLKDNEFTEEALNQINNGIPQGNAISAVLSNLMLLEFDKLSKFKELKMIRYADDMVFICKDSSEAHSILEWLTEYLYNERKLTIHSLSSGKDAKTIIMSNLKKKRLLYLGVEFDGENLFPTKQCQAQLKYRIKSIIALEEISPEQRIEDIKTCISQWCGYYAFTNIKNKDLNRIGIIINKLCKNAFGEKWQQCNINRQFTKYRKRQNRKGLKRILPAVRFGEDYRWLMVYE